MSDDDNLRRRPEGRDPRRWIAVAAAVTLVAGGGIALAARQGDRRTSAPSPSTIVAVDSTTQITPVATPSADPTTESTTAAPANCEDTAATSYDEIGSMHTVVPSGQPISVIIVPTGSAWCTAGHGEADVTLTNHGAGVEHVQDAKLVLHGGSAKWALEDWPPFDLGPGGSRVLHASFTVPGVSPGQYGLIVYGYDGFAEITVDGPVLCAGNDLSVVASSGDRVMGNVRTDVVVTNHGAVPCLIPDPLIVFGLRPDGTMAQVNFSHGTYFGEPMPLSSHVVPAGGRAALIVGTGAPDVCAASVHSPQPWIGLRFDLSIVGNSSVDAIVALDSACGIGISAWGQPG
jgi:hypothetical protein